MKELLLDYTKIAIDYLGIQDEKRMLKSYSQRYQSETKFKQLKIEQISLNKAIAELNKYVELHSIN